MTKPKTRSRGASPNHDARGLHLGLRVSGKYLFRVRETHVANHLIPMMAARRLGTAKLDLVLRCIALQESHAGKRETGLVLPRYSWSQLHDLCRGQANLGSQATDLDPVSEVVRLKRKWVGEQLHRLEDLKLVRRIAQPGGRSKLVVLRDDGSGRKLDDPAGSGGDSYVTILGGVISSGELADWGTPELSAYIAAMVAERFDRGAKENAFPGTGRWFRPLAWFADREGIYGQAARVRLPFSVSTLERGFKSLEAKQLVVHDHTVTDPRTRRLLRGRRNHYANQLDRLYATAEVLSAAKFARDQLPDEDVP